MSSIPGKKQFHLPLLLLLVEVLDSVFGTKIILKMI